MGQHLSHTEIYRHEGMTPDHISPKCLSWSHLLPQMPVYFRLAGKCAVVLRALCRFDFLFVKDHYFQFSGLGGFELI